MNLKGVQKLYDQFTPDERFRLTVQALAREDRAEVDRLGRACPWNTHGSYVERLEAGTYLTMAVLLELAPKLAKLRMIEAFRLLGQYLENLEENATVTTYLDGFEAGARAAWGRAGRTGRMPRLHADDADLDAATERGAELRATYERVVEMLATHMAADARAPWEAFERFCRDELELPPRTVIAAWVRPGLANLEEFAPALEAAEADTVAVDTLADLLRCAWRRRALGDETAEISEDTRAALAAEECEPA